MKLIMTRGLPASGKTYWSREQVRMGNGQVRRVNKDDLRTMIDNTQWSKENESHILAIRDAIIQRYLSFGFDVIVDDTNLNPKHEARLREIAADMEADFEIKDFTGVSLSTCLKRDSERANPVGEKVIRRMYNSYLKEKVNVAQYVRPPFNPDLPNCIIVDIDGTLAHMQGRSPYDYSKVGTDILDENVAEIVRRYAYGPEFDTTHVVIVSGRKNDCKTITEEWLKQNSIPYSEIHMRKADDDRNDAIVKQEIYEEWIKPRFNVRFVLDDRDRVVKMWREQGLKCLQVAEGDF